MLREKRGGSYDSNCVVVVKQKSLPEKEELHFQFEEDLYIPTGRNNTFSEWYVCYVYNSVLS